MIYEEMTKRIRSICEKLLENKEVDLIIAYTGGGVDGAQIPFFATEPADAKNIEWGDRCCQNLAKYLHGLDKKAGILARPCDARAIVQYITEQQVKREDVYIIGVDCLGLVDENGDPRPGCSECSVHNPPLYDDYVKDNRVPGPADAAASATESIETDAAETDGAEASATAAPPQSRELFEEETASGPAADVGATESKETDAAEADGAGSANAILPQNLERFKKEIDKCILCYACRQACYGCYCKTCFIERDLPDWAPAEIDAGTKMTFHLGRTMHLAGRCVECGACEAACQSGVNLRYIIKEVTEFVGDVYGYSAGMDAEERPALLTNEFDDREIGFLGGETHE